MRARVTFRDLPAAASATAFGRDRAADAASLALCRLTVLLLPVNWLLGTTLPWMFAVAFVLILRGRSFSLLEALFLWLIAALALGLLVALSGGGIADRALASIFNMSVIVVLVGFLNAGVNLGGAATRTQERCRLYGAARTIFWLNGAFVLAVFAITTASGRYDLSMRTLLLGQLGELPGVFGVYSEAVFSVIDWTTAGPEPRVIGFGIYATEGALLFLLLGLLGGIDAVRRGRTGLWLAIEAALVIGLVLMASRTTLLAYLVSVPLLFVLWRGRLARLAIVALPVVAVGGVIAAFYGGDAVSAFIAAQNESRLGSSGTRFLSYTTAIHMVLDENLLTGLGIKPRDDTVLLIPIGSHSSPISIFTKGGLVALLVLASIYAVLLYGIVRAQLVAWLAPIGSLSRRARFELLQLSRAVLVILVWWLTEDFDVPLHEAGLAGLAFGLFWAVLGRSAAPLTSRNDL